MLDLKEILKKYSSNFSNVIKTKIIRKCDDPALDPALKALGLKVEPSRFRWLVHNNDQWP